MARHRKGCLGKEITNSSVWFEAAQPVGEGTVTGLAGVLTLFHRCFGKLMEKLKECKQDNGTIRFKF